MTVTGLLISCVCGAIGALAIEAFKASRIVSIYRSVRQREAHHAEQVAEAG